MRRKIASVVSSTIFLLLSYIIPEYLKVNNVITQENSYLLLVISVILLIIMIASLVWGFWSWVKILLKTLSRIRIIIKLDEQAEIRSEKTKTEKVVTSQTIVPITYSRGQLRTDDITSAKLGRWTLEQLTRERQMPRDFIDVYAQKLHLYLDSVSGPFLYFRFVIKSHALHTLDLHDSVLSGFIEYREHELAGEKKLEINKTHATLKREDQTTVIVKQFLQPETATHLRQLHDSKDAEEAVFSFGKVSISAIAYRPDETTESWVLPLTSVFKRRISDELIRS